MHEFRLKLKYYKVVYDRGDQVLVVGSGYLPLVLFLLLFISPVSLSSCACWLLSGLGNSVGMGMSPEVHERGSKSNQTWLLFS